MSTVREGGSDALTVRRVLRSERQAIIDAPDARTYRQTRRVVAIRMRTPFEVEVNGGFVSGGKGDYVATIHPEDGTSDVLWVIPRGELLVAFEEIEPATTTAISGRPLSGRAFSMEEAAKYLAVHPETLRRFYRKSRVRGRKDRLHVGTPLVFRQEDLDAFRDSMLITEHEA